MRPHIKENVKYTLWAIVAVAFFVPALHFTLRILGAPYC